MSGIVYNDFNLSCSGIGYIPNNKEIYTPNESFKKENNYFGYKSTITERFLAKLGFLKIEDYRD